LYNNEADSPLHDRIKKLLTGTFDNEAQAMEAQLAGRPTAAEGGHERVSCRIHSHPQYPQLLVATYFIDQRLKQTFRYRYYEVVPPGKSDGEDGKFCAKMNIFRPTATASRRLIDSNYDPNIYLPTVEEMEYLPACDIGWRTFIATGPEFENSPQAKGNLKFEFEGVLLGSGELRSERNRSVELLVKDQLLLSIDGLSINDRVYEKASGVQLIGNTLGIPYLLHRVNTSSPISTWKSSANVGAIVGASFSALFITGALMPSPVLASAREALDLMSGREPHLDPTLVWGVLIWAAVFWQFKIFKWLASF
jgi:hypothetical protein